jgi:hypothetical protein
MTTNLQAIITNGTRPQLWHHSGLPTLLEELTESDCCFWPVFPLIDGTKKYRHFVAGLTFRKLVDQTKNFCTKNSLGCAVELNH